MANNSNDDERGFFSERWLEPPAKAKAAKDKSPETPHYHGHRDRLRERFVAGGPDALPDYELLELLLFRLIPRVDTKPIAKALLARFGTFGEVLGAPVALLQEVKGIGPAVAVDLKVIAASAQRMAKTEVHGREVLSNWTQLLAYCRSAMAFEKREQFRILFLDKKNVLIADEVQQVGTVDHTPVYPREVVKRALELSASAVILVHNHPSGDPTPSRADIEMTKQIIDSARPLGISVHDHIIIGKGGNASMKGLLLI